MVPPIYTRSPLALAGNENSIWLSIYFKTTFLKAGYCFELGYTDCFLVPVPFALGDDTCWFALDRPCSYQAYSCCARMLVIGVLSFSNYASLEGIKVF